MKDGDMVNSRSYRLNGLFIPAKTHPDVIVKSVAARDQAKANTYAQEHGIQDVKESYQGKLSINN